MELIAKWRLRQILPWQGLFWVMVPIAGGMLLAGLRWVPNVSETKHVPLDVLSVLLSAVAFSALIYGLSSVGSAAISETPIAPWIPLTVGVFTLEAFGEADRAQLGREVLPLPGALSFSINLAAAV